MRTRPSLPGLMMTLAAALVLAGCAIGGPAASHPAAPTTAPAPTNSTPPPAQPSGQAAPPPATAQADPCAAVSSSSPVVEVWGNLWPARRASGAGTCRFVVDTGPLQIEVRAFDAPNEAAALAAVQVTGAASEWPAEARPYNGETIWQVSYHLQGGPVGQTVQVRFQPAPSAQPLNLTLVRQASPIITVSLAGPDGNFVPLTPGTSLPPGLKRLRFQAPSGVDLDLTKAFHTEDWFDRLQPDRITKVSDTVQEVAFDNPPPLVTMELLAVDADGLRTPNQSAHFYTGDPPELLAVNGDGHRTRIGFAPPDVESATIRPDGRYAALLTLVPEQVEGVTYWLLDLRTGALTRTPFVSTEWTPPDFDTRGRLIAPLDRGAIGILTPETGAAQTLRSVANHWLPVSPDGRFIAGRTGWTVHGGTGGWNGPPRNYNLVIRDLQLDQEHVYPWDPQAPYGGLGWLPDGRLVQETVQSNQQPGIGPASETTWHYFTVDVRTGQRTPYESKQPPATDWHHPQPADRPDERILAKFPDGRTLLLHWPNLPHARRWPPP